MQDAVQQLRDLAADIDVQADPRLSAGTVNAAVQNNQNRWQAFLGDLAEFHSRLMRHMLVLVARYYTQERQIQIRGQYGWMPLESFNGQDMRSQVNVRVLPGSLEARSRQAIQQEISWVQTNWPGAVSPEAALSAIHGGSYDGLLRSYENDVAKAWRIIRRLRTGPQAINSFGTRFEQNTPDLSHGVDPLTGQFPLGVQVPNWMPAPQDNIQIWRTVIGDYMKTEDYEHQLPEVQNNFPADLGWLDGGGADARGGAGRAAADAGPVAGDARRITSPLSIRPGSNRPMTSPMDSTDGSAASPCSAPARATTTGYGQRAGRSHERRTTRSLTVSVSGRRCLRRPVQASQGTARVIELPGKAAEARQAERSRNGGLYVAPRKNNTWPPAVLRTGY
jgi:hypothetical protein